MEPALTDVHCAHHARFIEDCAVCKRARANFLPYPVQSQKPLPRSFGYTDNISEEELRSPAGRNPNFTVVSGGDGGEFNLSLMAIRFILRLIWPFGRIGP